MLCTIFKLIKILSYDIDFRHFNTSEHLKFEGILFYN